MSLGGIFIGLSGLQSFSDGLRQVSNNISNLNTPGYKGSTVSFRDLKSDGEGGGGVELAEQAIDFSQGELRQSDRDLDLAIDGEGFLVVAREGELSYLRTGSFEVDASGFIVLRGTDYRLTVMGADGVPAAVSIDANRTSAPTATTRVTFADNLSSTADSHTVPNLRVYNALGEEAVWSAEFKRDAAASGQWTVKIFDAGNQEIGGGTLSFLNGVVDPATREIVINDAAGGRSVTLDFSGSVSSFSSGSISNLRAAEVDGYRAGEITTVRIDEAGVLELGYSNEQTVDLGGIAIAAFREPQELDQRSGGRFVHNAASGVDYMTSAHERVGRVLSRRLEASNIDLSQQFGELILVQRGFQASSQVVSISNDMIQQLFGIRGQG